VTDYIKFPGSPTQGSSEGQSRFDEFEKTLFHNWSTALANPTLWYVQIDHIPHGLRFMNKDNIVNKEGPNNYDQFNNNQENLFKTMTNNIGCMVVHGVTLPEMSVEASRSDPKLGGYYGGVVADTIKEQNQLQIEFRETQSSITEFIIRPWIEAVAKYGFIARKANDKRNVKCRITIVQLGVAGPGTDPVRRKIWEFYNCAPTSVANHRLAHDGTWSAADQFINCSWVYSHYNITDVRFENMSELYKSHITNAAIKPIPGTRTSGRIGASDGPAAEIVVQ
tara:strand:+ start:3036 stop:3875 length:840 start_codon:yes stop_codon:yes gene_type:complete